MNEKPEKPEKPAGKKENILNRFLKFHGKYRGITLFIIVALWLALLGASLYFCWFYLTPMIWMWAFNTETGAWWKGILAVLGAFYLVIMPPVLFGWGWDGVKGLMSGYVEAQEAELKAKLKNLSGRQETAEDKLVANDSTGLIPLIQYSRIQLEAYYTIGLSQTQRSFRYSILAMWIGFIVIVSGLGLYIYPFITPNMRASLGDIHIITIAGGVVIEIISALFLWIYRSSINQLNYFYNRQMHIHNVLLCDRIAASMKNPDDTKRLIVEKVLGSIWEVKPLNEPGRGISKLIQETK